MGWKRAQLNKAKRRWYECMYWFYVKFVLNQFTLPACKRCIGSTFKSVYTFKFLYSAEGSFPRNSKILPETTLTQRWKKVARDFRTLGLRCHNVTTTSLNSVATTLSSIVGGTFISNDLTMLRLTFYVSREWNMQRVE